MDARGARRAPRPRRPQSRLLGLVRPRVRRERRAQLGARAGRREVGHLRGPGGRAPPAARRPRRPRRHRARLRDRLRLGVAGASRRAARRHRQLAQAARDRDPPPGRARPRLPAAARQRRARPLPRRLVRLRDQRVRRRAVGRPVRLDPRGRAPAATRRPAGVPDQPPAGVPDGARPRGRRPRRRSAQAPDVRDARRSAGPTSPNRSSSTSRTATGSGCCAPTGSRSRTWSRSGRRRARRPPTTG